MKTVLAALFFTLISVSAFAQAPEPKELDMLIDPFFCVGYVNHAMNSKKFSLDFDVFIEKEKESLIIIKNLFLLKGHNPYYGLPMNVQLHKIFEVAKTAFETDAKSPDATKLVTEKFDKCLSILDEFPSKLGFFVIKMPVG